MSNTLSRCPEWQALQAAKAETEEAEEHVLACLRVNIKSGPQWLKVRDHYIATSAKRVAAYEAWEASPAYQEMKAG